MKKRIKHSLNRVICLLIVLCMAIAVLPATASAALEKQFYYYDWFLGDVKFQIGDNIIDAEKCRFYYYEDGNEPITMILTPSEDYADEIPYVVIDIDDYYSDEHSVELELEENDGIYTASFTPNALWSGVTEPNLAITVYVNEYFALWPDDDQFMIWTNVEGGDEYGSVLLQSGANIVNHQSSTATDGARLDKIVYDRKTYSDTVDITFIPKAGKKLSGFMIGDDMYGYESSDEPTENKHPLPELTTDGQYSTTITIPALSDTEADNTLDVEVYFEDVPEEDIPGVPTNLYWKDKTAKWDAVEGADHYRVYLQRGYSDGWTNISDYKAITDECSFDFSNSIDLSDSSAKYRFCVCAIKDGVCSDTAKSYPYSSSINVGVKDLSVDKSSIKVNINVNMHNVDTEEELSFDLGSVIPEDVTVGNFKTAKADAINEAKAMLYSWLKLMREDEENKDYQFTVVGDIAEEGDKTDFDNREYAMEADEQGRYMKVTGDYGYKGIYSVTMTVDVQRKDDTHTHNLTLVPAKESTCTEAGNKAYYTCDGCDDWFEDAEGTSVINNHGDAVISATGHTGVGNWLSDAENHWKICDCGEIVDKAVHDCGDDDVCDVCGYTKQTEDNPTEPVPGATEETSEPTEPGATEEPSEPGTTEEPNEPTAPGESTDPTEKPDNPDTGVVKNMGLWIALVTVSLSGVAGTTIYSIKKKYSEK